MKTNILNAGYESNLRISKGKGQFLYDINNKKLLDLSMCSGTMILGHSSKVFNKAINVQKKLNLILRYFLKQKNIMSNIYLIIKNIFS